MRWPVLVVLALVAACGSTSNGACPGPQSDDLSDSPCPGIPNGTVCFVENNFSSCASAFYRCDGGKWTLDHPLGATDGASCTDSPLDSCSTEGNPGCTVNPTSELCTCDADGTWHCDCACYGGLTSCPLLCPPRFPGVGDTGPLCASPGDTCSYPDHTCTCDADGHFHCT